MRTRLGESHLIPACYPPPEAVLSNFFSEILSKERKRVVWFIDRFLLCRVGCHITAIRLCSACLLCIFMAWDNSREKTRGFRRSLPAYSIPHKLDRLPFPSFFFGNPPFSNDLGELWFEESTNGETSPLSNEVPCDEALAPLPKSTAPVRPTRLIQVDL